MMGMLQRENVFLRNCSKSHRAFKELLNKLKLLKTGLQYFVINTQDMHDPLL